VPTSADPSPTTYYVSVHGDDANDGLSWANAKRTIQSAINAASAGDTIVVGDGIYAENPNVDKRLTIRSENGPSVTVIQTPNPNDHVFEVTADNITIAGFTIENATTAAVAGIYLDNSKNCRIENNVTKNNYHGICLWYSDNNTLSGNTVENNQWNGISLYDSDNNTLSGNTVENNQGDGIPLYDSNNNTLSGNTVENNQWNGISLYNSDNNTLSGNTVENNQWNGISLYNSDNNTLSGNTVENNQWNGISLHGSDNNTLSGNTVENNRLSGILLFYSDNNTLSGNTVENNQEDGIHLSHSNNNTLSGNTVENNQWNGIRLHDSDNNTLSGNTVENNRLSGIHPVYSDNNTLSGNTVENNQGDGIHLSHSNNNTLSGNTVENNRLSGIHLFYSDNNTLSGNTVENNQEDGIHLSHSNNNTLSGNTVENNQWNGIRLHDSDNNLISNNVCQNNSQHDINCSWSYGNTFEANTCSTFTGIPRISGVAASGITHSSATISWTTAAPSNSVVEYGTTTAYGLTRSDASMVTSHSITLSGLSASTTYYYRVRSTDENNNIEISRDFTFTTRAAPKTDTSLTIDPESFALVSGQLITLTATLVDAENNPLAGKTISWGEANDRGSFSVTSTTTDENGRASITYTAAEVDAKTQVRITASFEGDNEYQKSSAISLGVIIPSEVAEELENLTEKLQDRARELEVEVENEHLEKVGDAFLGNDLGAVISISIIAGVPMIEYDYQHPDIEISVEVEIGEDVEVRVSSELPYGKTILVHLDRQTLPVTRLEDLVILLDGENVGLAANYGDVLDPTDENVPEFLVMFGAEGIQVLVSIPGFTERTITIAVYPTVPVVGFPSLYMVALVAIVLLFAILAVIWRRMGAGVPEA
jgi:parallel beta-helix repeat protein